MSKSTHQIAIKGVDNTAGAFNSIKGRAVATGAQIRSMLGGALAAAGAYLGLRKFKDGVDELGHLSDVAMKTSASVDELTAAANALNVLGIQNMNIEQLAKSFDYMAKATGRSGMDGLYKTIEELGKIEDVSERSKAAIRVFGRSGMEFMPLVNAAKDGTDALRKVVSMMPKVTQAAARAGDDVSDAMNIASSEVHSVWLRTLAKICQMFGTNFSVAALKMNAGIELGVGLASRHFDNLFLESENGLSNWRIAWNNTVSFIQKKMVILSATIFEIGKQIARTLAMVSPVGLVSNILQRIPVVSDLVSSGGILGKIFPRYGELSKSMEEYLDFNNWADSFKDFYPNIEKEMKSLGIDTGETFSEAIGSVFKSVDTEDLFSKYREAIASIESDAQNAIDNAAISISKRLKDDASEDGISIKSPEVRNELMLAGSNAANRAAILGPQLQAETKKQTTLLGKIVNAVDKNTEAVKDGGADYGVID